MNTAPLMRSLVHMSGTGSCVLPIEAGDWRASTGTTTIGISGVSTPTERGTVVYRIRLVDLPIKDYVVRVGAGEYYWEAAPGQGEWANSVQIPCGIPINGEELVFWYRHQEMSFAGIRRALASNVVYTPFASIRKLHGTITRSFELEIVENL